MQDLKFNLYYAKFNTNDVNADQLESYRLRWLNEKALGKMTGASDLEKAAIANLVTIENDTKLSSD